MKNKKQGTYIWDSMDTNDKDSKILGRYRYIPPEGGDGFSVAKIFVMDDYPQDVFVKVSTLLPLPFGSLFEAERFVMAFFRESIQEHRQ